jgi:hypothetical protein
MNSEIVIRDLDGHSEIQKPFLHNSNQFTNFSNRGGVQSENENDNEGSRDPSKSALSKYRVKKGNSSQNTNQTGNFSNKMRGMSLLTYDKWKLKAGATYANQSDKHTHDLRRDNLFKSQQVSDTYILQFEELFKWPASIEDALIHERANSLG